ncbi:imelysin family protein [uncultured Sulfitobacter sp.]|uniref:imelysin family protein n=1 Tax=uncultured Sulfitobacter sp. TaxID=191468 RepID=UPI002624427A|nr:imelysin family protein [uncultured Sulfitobacter sp.]
MRRFVMILACVLIPSAVGAGPKAMVIEDSIEGHILPRFERLAEASDVLAQTAGQGCTGASDALVRAYRDAFDAWISASHLRFGPTEVEDRAFALAFWPDSRGKTPRALRKLIAEADPIGLSVTDYAQMSIAARGFHALEFLLFDPGVSSTGDAGYRCRLVQTVAGDIAVTAGAILKDWQTDYAARLRTPRAQGTYRTEDEAVQVLFKALTTGLQFTSEVRLGRPLGTFDRPRPKRAESWRSGRSARHVMLSLRATRDLALRLAAGDAAVHAALEDAFGRALTRLEALNDPVFAGVADPQGRLKVEVMQQAVDSIRAVVQQDLGPTLGVVAGFNALDGD